jgi:hypothetical protein
LSSGLAHERKEELMEIFAEEHGRSTMRESKRNVKEDRGKEVTKGDEREEGEREREREGGVEGQAVQTHGRREENKEE